MKFLVVFLGLILPTCGYHQASPTIAIPQTPRVIIKEVSIGNGVQTTTEVSQESFSRPNLTRGYIENQAFPYVPRVWLIKGGKKVLLAGQTKKGHPNVLYWQILEFDLPPGINQVIIERWRYTSPEIGWQMLPPEFKEFHVARPRRGWGDWCGSGYWSDSHYDWRIIIRQNCSFIYTGGRPDFLGHGRRGW